MKQIDQLLKYLNPSGPRELLKERIEVLYTKIVAAVSEAVEKTDLMNRPENAPKSEFNTNAMATTMQILPHWIRQKILWYKCVKIML